MSGWANVEASGCRLRSSWRTARRSWPARPVNSTARPRHSRAVQAHERREGCMSGPLQGVRVVEPAAIGPAPFAGALRADHGADVVRVDRGLAAACDARRGGHRAEILAACAIRRDVERSRRLRCAPVPPTRARRSCRRAEAPCHGEARRRKVAPRRRNPAGREAARLSCGHPNREADADAAAVTWSAKPPRPAARRRWRTAATIRPCAP